MLHKFELDAKSNFQWFTCATLAFKKDTGEECIALGTSNGVIYTVDVGPGLSCFTKKVGFT